MPSKTLVCFGDSLTEGAVSVSYVDMLRRYMPDVRIVNAGINGDTTDNLLRRVERDVVPHHPDLITILVGMNDLGSAYGVWSSKLYYRLAKGIHKGITQARFEVLYRRLITVLRERTSAQIALCTLTALGELPDDAGQQLVDSYSAVIRRIAVQEQLPLIDLRAAFHKAIVESPHSGRDYRIWMPPLDQAAIRWRKQTYANLSARRGLRLLSDGVHLAEPGAALVAETMLPTIEKMLTTKAQQPQAK